MSLEGYITVFVSLASLLLSVWVYFSDIKRKREAENLRKEIETINYENHLSNLIKGELRKNFRIIFPTQSKFDSLIQALDNRIKGEEFQFGYHVKNYSTAVYEAFKPEITKRDIEFIDDTEGVKVINFYNFLDHFDYDLNGQDNVEISEMQKLKASLYKDALEYFKMCFDYLDS